MLLPMVLATAESAEVSDVLRLAQLLQAPKPPLPPKVREWAATCAHPRHKVARAERPFAHPRREKGPGHNPAHPMHKSVALAVESSRLLGFFVAQQLAQSRSSSLQPQMTHVT